MPWALHTLLSLSLLAGLTFFDQGAAEHIATYKGKAYHPEHAHAHTAH